MPIAISAGAKRKRNNSLLITHYSSLIAFFLRCQSNRQPAGVRKFGQVDVFSDGVNVVLSCPESNRGNGMPNHPVGVQAAIANSQTRLQAGHLGGSDSMTHNQRIRVQAEGMVLQSGLKADLGAPAAVIAHLAGGSTKG